MGINQSAKHLIVKRLTALVLAVSLIASISACAGNTGSESTADENSRKESLNQVLVDKKIHVKIKEMLGVDISDDYIDGAEMSVDKSADSYGKVKIQIKEGKDAELLQYLESTLGKFQEIDANQVPRYQDHQYATELKQMHTIKHAVTFKSGTFVKSIDINVYMAEMSGYKFLFIFG